MEQLQEYEEALLHLEAAEDEKWVRDVMTFLEYKARLEMKVQRTTDADEHWRQLIDLNPDNIDYYLGFLRNQGIILGKQLLHHQKKP